MADPIYDLVEDYAKPPYRIINARRLLSVHYLLRRRTFTYRFPPTYEQRRSRYVVNCSCNVYTKRQELGGRSTSPIPVAFSLTHDHIESRRSFKDTEDKSLKLSPR